MRENGIAVGRLRVPHRDHPVAVLGRELGLPDGVVGPVRDVAQAYQPGTGDEALADAGVDRLVALLGGRFDEPTAARVGVLVQACEPTAALVERAAPRRRRRPAAGPAGPGDAASGPGGQGRRRRRRRGR